MAEGESREHDVLDGYGPGEGALPGTGVDVSEALHSVASVAALSAAHRPADADELGRQVTTAETLPLPRNTQSALKAVQHSRGLPAVLAHYPIPMQHALRQVCIERLNILSRLDVAKKRLEDSVSAGEAFPDDKPDILIRLEDRLQENRENLIRVIGGDRDQALESAIVIEDALESDEYRTQFALPVYSELAAREGGKVLALTPYTSSPSERGEHMARVFRRKLDTGKPSRKVLGVYGRPTHAHPNKRGDKTVWDKVAAVKAAGDEPKLSYYQRLQRRYGKERRGSTAIAGAWEAVFDSKTHQERRRALEERQAEMEAAPGLHTMAAEYAGMAARGRGNDRIEPARDTKMSDGEAPSAAAAAAAHRAAMRLERPNLAPGAGDTADTADTTTELHDHMVSAARHAAATAAETGVTSGPGGEELSSIQQARAVFHAARRRHAASSPAPVSAHAPGVLRGAETPRADATGSPSSAHRPPRAPRPVTTAMPASGNASAAAASGAGAGESGWHGGGARATTPRSSVVSSPVRAGTGLRGNGRRSAAQSFRSAVSGARSAVARPAPETVGGFATGDLELVMPTLRRTQSAISAAVKHLPPDNAALIFSKLSLSTQRAAKLLVSELAELQERWESAYDRLQASLGHAPLETELPEVMLGIDAFTATKRDELTRRVGPSAAKQLIDIVQDPEARRAMGLVSETEEMQHEEADARQWRRQLARFKSVRFESSNKPKTLAAGDGASASGRDLFGMAERRARKDGENISYYKRQQRKYGKGRRGSTSHSGGWDEVFAEQKQEAAADDGLRVVHSATDIFADS